MIDIGSNLTHRSFRADLAEVIHRANAAGVQRMVVTGLSVEVSRQAEQLASTRPAVLRSTAGIHPHNAKSFDSSSVSALRWLAERSSVVAIGECGLDYNRDFSPRDVQRRAFEAQLELAVELEMPVFLHERDAHEDFVRILGRYRDSLVGGVVHCFTGDEPTLDAYLEMDLHIGLTGWITDPRRGAHLPGLVARIPDDRLMIETDSPFLKPRGARGAGRRNEPANLPLVRDAVARAKRQPPTAVARDSARVAERFFEWPKSGVDARAD